MKMKSVLSVLLVTFLLTTSATLVSASDFGWTKNLNVRAEADPSGFRAQLSTRFNLGGAQVDAVLGNVECAADAYMVLRLGEMSSKPTDHVMQQYRAQKHKGWGVLAKSLGIKPGSSEFQALKQGSDIGDPRGKGKSDSKSKKKNNAGNSKKKGKS